MSDEDSVSAAGASASAQAVLASGFNLKEVSEWLGHCDIGTTANIYAHLQFQAKIDMGRKMSEHLFSAES
jgi:site-specific recombinase XerD